MLEIRITILAPDLSTAIEHLAAATRLRNSVPVPVQQPAAVSVAKPVAAAKAENATQAQQEQAAGSETAEATPPPEQKPGRIITLQMLSEAGAKLLDQGKMPDVIAALGKYGVPSLTALKPDKYDALAEDFKMLGVEV